MYGYWICKRLNLIEIRDAICGALIDSGFIYMYVRNVYVSVCVLTPATVWFRPSSVAVCQSIDIRNSVDQFSKLEGCRVVEGFVQILLIDRAEQSAYANLTFPDLVEITGYLILYRYNIFLFYRKYLAGLSTHELKARFARGCFIRLT